MRGLVIVLAIAVLAALAFITGDCVGAPRETLKAEVLGRRFVPARTETTWHYDEECRCNKASTHYYPAEYWVDFVTEIKVDSTNDKKLYMLNAKACNAVYAVGRWTSHRYLLACEPLAER